MGTSPPRFPSYVNLFEKVRNVSAVHCKSRPVYSCQPPLSLTRYIFCHCLTSGFGETRAILAKRVAGKQRMLPHTTLAQISSLVLLIIIQYHSRVHSVSPVSSRSLTHFSILEECDVVRDLKALSLWPAEGAKGRAKPITANREKSSQDKNCIPARRDAEENREDAARGPQGFLNRVA